MSKTSACVLCWKLPSVSYVRDLVLCYARTCVSGILLQGLSKDTKAVMQESRFQMYTTCTLANLNEIRSIELLTECHTQESLKRVYCPGSTK
jgi:hypothetical protein